MNCYYVILVQIILIAVVFLWQWRHQRLLSLRARLMREALRTAILPFACLLSDFSLESVPFKRFLMIWA